MEISIFLAKVLGLYTIIMAISMQVNVTLYKTIMSEMIQNPSLLLFNGIIALFAGILLVISHNIWVADWRVVVTLLAWTSLLKGILYVSLPQSGLTLIKQFMQSKMTYQISVIFTFILGVYLCYWGFEFNPMLGTVE